MEYKKGEIPMLGAAYYPEAWDESEQDHDIAYMKKAGLNVVRIGEFAWHKMEPCEEQYDFTWLHNVIDKLWSAGVAVILGTPTATPPVWLEEKDPTMFRLDEVGLRELHGGRRHCCSNNETYRKYSARITERMAREFGGDDRIIGWQIDNEIYIKEKGCFCKTCQRKFQEYLVDKYKTIENLNQQWNLNLFSQWYDRFDQIPMPAKSWQNPHLRYEWMMFQGQSHIEFIQMQADILHKYVNVPVGTDMMPMFGVDHEKIAKITDVMQFNHYNDESNLWDTMFWFDYLRTLKSRAFWNMETSTCWNQSTAMPANLRPKGFCKIISWLPILLGGEANLYWLWRQHWAGHELMHGAVLYASGRPMYIFGEVQKTAEEYRKASALLSETKIVTDVALMVSSQNSLLMEQQQVVEAPGNPAHSYRKRVLNIYKAIVEHGVRPDVIGVEKELDGYKLIFTPYMLTLEHGNLQERICEWVKKGGTWIAGPLTDIRNGIGAHYKNKETGILEWLTNAKLVDQIPDGEHRVTCAWEDGTPFLANMILQLWDVSEDASALVTVVGDYHSALKGKAVAFQVKVGEGTVIVLGTMPSEQDVDRLVMAALKTSKAQHFDICGKAMIAKRNGIVGDVWVLAEYENQTAIVKLNGQYYDILSEEEYSEIINLNPYQVMILQKR